MFHSKTLNSKINQLDEKALRTAYEDYKPKFDELFETNGSFSIHYRNIQTFAIEIFKFLNGLSPKIMNKVFQFKSPAPYCLSDENELHSRDPRIVAYGTKAISFMAPKIQSIVHQELKYYQYVYISFKKSIRKWSLTVHVGNEKPTYNMLGFL